MAPGGMPASVSASTARHGQHVAVTLLRHMLAYGSGAGMVLVLALANALLLAHLLAPAEFGVVSLLLVIASLTTLLAGLLVRRGAISRTYGRVDDEDGDDGDAAVDQSLDSRAALGTGMALTVAGGVAAGSVLVAGGAPIAQWLGLPTALDHATLALAAALGTEMALWDLVLAIPRVERRPRAFVGVSLLRSVVVLGLTLTLVSANPGVTAALLAYLAGSGVSLAAALVGFRRSYRIAFSRAEVRPIVLLSLRRVPRQTSNWVLRNIDLLAVASVGSAAEIGWYRLANRLVMPLSAASTAFFTAWAPLERSPTVLAADSTRGRQAVRAVAGTYLLFTFVGLSLVVLICADALRHVIPSSYDAALEFVPWLAVVALAHILLTTANRFARFANRRRVYDWTLIVSALLSIPVTLLLAAWLGPQGAAGGVLLVLLAASVHMWARSQRGPAPVPFDAWRIAGALAIAAGSLLIAFGGRAVWPSLGTVFAAAGLAAYPLFLIGFGVIGSDQRQALRELPGPMRGRIDSDAQLALRSLDDDQRAALRAALADPASGESHRGALAALRTCTGTRTRADALELAIASYLFEPRSFLERHRAVFTLYRAKVRPDEIATLERWRDDARRAMSGDLDAPGNGVDRVRSSWARARRARP